MKQQRSAPISATNFTLSGGGTLILTNSANSLSATTTINTGTLQGNAASLTSNINVGSGTNVVFDQPLGNNGAYSYNLTGSGTAIKQDSGTLALSGNNPGFTGAFNVTGGTLSISADAQLGASNPSIVNVNGGTLQTTAGITSCVLDHRRQCQYLLPRSWRHARSRRPKCHIRGGHDQFAHGHDL